MLLENIKDDFLDGLENTGEKTMRFSRPNSIGMRNAIIEDVFTISDGNGDVAFQKQSELMTMSEKDYHHTVDQFAEVALNISENNAKRKEKISQDRQHIQELKKENPTVKRGYNFIEGVEDDFFVEIPVERSWGGAYYPFLSKKEGIENQIILQRYIDNMQEPASSMGILLNCQDLYKNAYRDKSIYNDPNTTIYWDSHGVVITRGNDNPKPSYVFRKGLDFYESHKDIDYDVSFNQARGKTPVTTMEKSVVGNHLKQVEGQLHNLRTNIYNNSNDDNLSQYIIDDEDKDSINDKFVAWSYKPSNAATIIDVKVYDAFIANPLLSEKNFDILFDKYPKSELTSDKISTMRNHPSANKEKIDAYVSANSLKISSNDARIISSQREAERRAQRESQRKANIESGAQVAASNPQLVTIVEQAVANAPSPRRHGDTYNVYVPQEVRNQLGDDYIESIMPDVGWIGSSYYDESIQAYRRKYDNYSD